MQPTRQAKIIREWERFQELRALSESGENEKALAGLQELLTNSECSDVRDAASVWASLSLRNLGQLKEAKKFLDQAVARIDKKSESYAWLLMCSAFLDFDEGNWKSALAKFDALLTDYATLLRLPENYRNLEDLNRKRGIALLGLDRPKEARPLLEHAATLDSEPALVSYCLGKCCYKLGEFERAEHFLLRSLQYNLEVNYAADAHYHLGMAYYRQFKHAWAVQEFDWCLNYDASRQVPRAYVLTGLINASKALGLERDVTRYSEMLRQTPP